MSNIELDLPIPFSENDEVISISFDSICVLLGANGVGKSRSLISLKNNLKDQNKRILYVEGGRVVNLPKNVRLETFDSLYQGNKNVDEQIKNLGFKDLKGRLRKALDFLYRKHVAEKVAFADSVSKWKKGDTSEPKQQETKLDHVINLFNKVFPQITLEIDVESEEMICRKNGNNYSPSDLSDGEKQVLSILADFAAFGSSIEIVICDEPELNLNPSLAVRLWNVIESDLANSKFLYATHSIGFTIRKNVDSVYVLSSDKSAIEIDDITSLRDDELQHFLGSVPAILSADKALVVEGEDNSIDSPFYNCLVSKKHNIAITSVGSSNNVLAARQQNGLWNKIAGRVKIVGIIDRDFRSDNEISILKSGNCIVLDLHELESYLCIPSLICGVANERALDPKPDEASVQDKIEDFLKDKRLKIITKRVERRLNLKLNPSIRRNNISTIVDLSSLKSEILQSASDEIEKANKVYTNEEVEKIIDRESEKIDQAIKSGNPLEMLKYAPGKQLLKRLLYLAGCKSEMELIMAAEKLDVLLQIPTINNLSKKINSHLK